MDNYSLKSLQQDVASMQGKINSLAANSSASIMDLYIAKKNAADFLGICYRTIERWYNQGYIRRTRIGGRIYYLKDELYRVAQLYSSGINTLTNNSNYSVLSELLQEHNERAVIRR